jgi:hypothetical protein
MVKGKRREKEELGGRVRGGGGGKIDGLTGRVRGWKK